MSVSYAETSFCPVQSYEYMGCFPVCFCTWTLQTVLQFFHARGEGLSLEDMKSGDYKVGTSCNRSAFMSGWKVRLMSSYPLCRLSLSPLWLFSRCFRPWMRSSGWISVPPSSWLNSTIWRRFPIRCVSTYRAVDLVSALEWTRDVLIRAASSTLCLLLFHLWLENLSGKTGCFHLM